MLPEISLKFNDNDEKLKDVSELVKSLVTLCCPKLSFQCSGTTSEGQKTLAWYPEPVLPDLDVDLELGLGPDHGKRKCSGQDTVSIGSALERMSASSTRDKTESPMSGVSAQSSKVMEEDPSASANFLNEAASLMNSLNRLCDQMSDHSCKMSDHSSKMSDHSSKMSDHGYSAGLSDERSGEISPPLSGEGHTSSSGVMVLSQESGSHEDWDRETRGVELVIPAPSPAPYTQTQAEPVIIDSRVSRSSPTDVQSKVLDGLQLNISVGIKSSNFSDPAKDLKWREDEEKKRKSLPLKNLLVSENMALERGRPEDINFAAKHDQERSKKKSGNAPRLG